MTSPKEETFLLIFVNGTTLRVPRGNDLEATLIMHAGKHVEFVGLTANERIAVYCSLPWKGLGRNELANAMLDVLGVDIEGFSTSELNGTVILTAPQGKGLSEEMLTALEKYIKSGDYHDESLDPPAILTDR